MPARLDIVQSRAPDRGEGEREAVTNALPALLISAALAWRQFHEKEAKSNGE
jgi:hypothetical protein